MFLERICLKQFRNYLFQELRFDRKINIFTGPNAQGKTNLLEAIYYLAASRSFRTYAEQDLVEWGKEYFYLSGTFIRGGNSCSYVEIGYQHPGQFQIKHNGAPVRRGDYIYQHPVVVFSPDDLLLIKEGPAGRRRFLNLEGSRLKPLYYNKLKDYHRVLQHRNRVLKEGRYGRLNRDLLEPWDQALITLGSDLIRQRVSLLQALEKQSRRFYSELTASEETLSLQYISSIEYDGDLGRVERFFAEKLAACDPLERKRGYTLCGPHLDDFSVLVDGYEAKKFASQGQQRAAALALKMGEVDLFGISRKAPPVVLLDDVFSEFDRNRQRQLLIFLKEREGQSFITSAIPFDRVSPDGIGACQIFSVQKGKIRVEGTGDNS